ncbi:carbohydrate binding domain-containing protein [Streptomyces sp. NPDC048385]|uniref:carbohydrate binding domain-containing protein n=1 Tax=Streptomyces sp. NPDC048385 TaxID=3155145 RepID=UPI0034366FE9
MSRTTRTRLRLGLGASAFLPAAGLLPSPAHAEDVTDYSVTVDPTAQGAKIGKTMYGVFFEDINRAADGGLYAELVQNRSFEYTTDDNKSYTPLTAWTVSGTAQVVDDDGLLNARNRDYLSLAAGSSVTNSGYNTGIRVEDGKRYDFSVWARAADGTALTVGLADSGGALATARQVAVKKHGWAPYRATFTATHTLLTDDFSGDAAQWTHTGGGSWAVQDGQYVETSDTAENTMVQAGDTGWHDYDLHVKAVKKSGKEGFLVAFGVKDTGTYYWWNIGGWNNTQTAVEQAVDGGKSTLIAKPGSVETGRAYDIGIKVRGRQVTLYLDGQEWGSFTDDKPAEPFRQVVTEDKKTGDLIVKVVNAQSAAARTTLDLGGAKVAGKARVTTLAAAPGAVNTETSTTVAPVTSTFTGVSDRFTYTFPANSITFLRIRQK